MATAHNMASDVPAVFLGAEKRKEPLFVEDDHKLPLDGFVIPEHYKGLLSHVIVPSGMLADRIEKLAVDILEDTPDEPPHLLVVLKGASEFASELVRALRKQHSFLHAKHLPFTVDYIRVRSYEGTESSGTVRISGIDLKTLKGRNIILCEDIIDTGHTMAKLVPHLMESGYPKSVKVAALMEKRTPKSCGYKAHYVGFSIPDAFVVGYNLDYNEAFRDLQHLCAINPAGIEHFKAYDLLAPLL